MYHVSMVNLTERNMNLLLRWVHVSTKTTKNAGQIFGKKVRRKHKLERKQGQVFAQKWMEWWPNKPMLEQCHHYQKVHTKSGGYLPVSGGQLALVHCFPQKGKGVQHPCSSL